MAYEPQYRTNVILGAQWGDEGGGAVISAYAKEADMVVRFNGGGNAGHTVYDEKGNKYVLNDAPSGVIFPHVINVLAHGCVPNLETLAKNMHGLETKVLISDAAHLMMPYHSALDKAREMFREQCRGGTSLGTTGKGIGPAYADKANRIGIRAALLKNPKRLEEALEETLLFKNGELRALGEEKQFTVREVLDWLEPYREQFAPCIIDTSVCIDDAIRQKKKVLFEKAQGALLDLDQGTYPYVTSSTTTIGGVLSGTGISHKLISRVIGVIKAYTTRVGEGPFPTEGEPYEEVKKLKKGEHTVTGEEEKLVRDGTGWEKSYDLVVSRWIREGAEEFGATTGRPRRIGWLDLVAVKKAMRINGCNYYALTRLDNLDGIRFLKVCTAYRHKETGEKTDIFPSDTDELAKYEPVYEIIPGWRSTKGIRTFAELPAAARNYINLITGFLAEYGVRPALIKNGPKQDEYMAQLQLWG